MVWGRYNIGTSTEIITAIDSKIFIGDFTLLIIKKEQMIIKYRDIFS
jgi:hypothetical protein